MCYFRATGSTKICQDLGWTNKKCKINLNHPNFLGSCLLPGGCWDRGKGARSSSGAGGAAEERRHHLAGGWSAAARTARWLLTGLGPPAGLGAGHTHTHTEVL